MKIKSKPWQVYALIGILVLGAVLITAKSCRPTSRYSILVGEYDILKQQYVADQTEALKAILTARDYIDNLREENKELVEHVELTETLLDYKDVKLSKLESDLIEARDTGDKDAIISTLEKQVTIWKEKFTLAEKIIADKDIIIFNLKQQYDSQLKISLDFENLYIESDALLNRSEVLLSITQRKLRTARVGSTIKNVAVIVLGAVIALKIVE